MTVRRTTDCSHPSERATLGGRSCLDASPGRGSGRSGRSGGDGRDRRRHRGALDVGHRAGEDHDLEASPRLVPLRGHPAGSSRTSPSRVRRAAEQRPGRRDRRSLPRRAHRHGFRRRPGPTPDTGRLIAAASGLTGRAIVEPPAAPSSGDVGAPAVSRHSPPTGWTDMTCSPVAPATPSSPRTGAGPPTAGTGPASGVTPRPGRGRGRRWPGWSGARSRRRAG